MRSVMLILGAAVLGVAVGASGFWASGLVDGRITSSEQRVAKAHRADLIRWSGKVYKRIDADHSHEFPRPPTDQRLMDIRCLLERWASQRTMPQMPRSWRWLGDWSEFNQAACDRRLGLP